MQWWPSRACVQAGLALYHVISINPRTWDCGLILKLAKSKDMYVESSDLQLCIPCRFRSDLQDFQCFAQTFNQRHVVSGYWASDQIQTFDRGADVPASMLNLTNFSSQFSNFLFCLCLFSFDSVLLCIHQWIRSDKILAFSENYRTYLFRFYQKVCRLFSALFFLRILPPNEKSS